MIRYRFIEKLVLDIYNRMPKITFPLQPKEIVDYISNCKYMSYSDFASLNDCSMQTVIQICESLSGCVQYDIQNDRYLIICNEDSNVFGNTIGRQRWTCAHEIGHILCNHFSLSSLQVMSENSFMQESNKQLEQEADFFASTMLAPFPLFDLFNINSPVEVRIHFGLSKQASEYQYNSFLKWKSYKENPAWINDLRKVYIEKGL